MGAGFCKGKRKEKMWGIEGKAEAGFYTEASALESVALALLVNVLRRPRPYM